MPIKSFRPLTPSLRYKTVVKPDGLSSKKPEKKLLKTKKKTGGRNSYGRVTARGIGGGNKQKIRTVDFRRKRHGDVAKVVAIEYDPIRTALLALIEYADGQKSYIIAAEGLKAGDSVVSGPESSPDVGNCLPLNRIPMGHTIHNIELHPGRGGQMVRSAGSGAVLMAITDGYAQVKLPSGEIRKVNEKCFATIGNVGNSDHEKVVLGKAGRTRHMGKRPITRAVAKNPHDHPMGGGEGRTSGGGHPVSPWGILAKGYKTRAKRKYSNRSILVRRNGKPFKRK